MRVETYGFFHQVLVEGLLRFEALIDHLEQFAVDGVVDVKEMAHVLI